MHWFDTQLKISRQISKMHVIGTPIICQRSGIGELRQQCCFCVFFWQDDQKLCKHPHNADGSAVMGGESFFVSLKTTEILLVAGYCSARSLKKILLTVHFSSDLF